MKVKGVESRFKPNDTVRVVGMEHHHTLRPHHGHVGEVIETVGPGLVLVRFPTGPAQIPQGALEPVVVETLPYDGPPRVYSVKLMLPPEEASANFRGHTMAKAPAIGAYRFSCCRAFVEHRVPVLRPPVQIDLKFYLCAKAIPKGRINPRDADNARTAAKAAQDALQDAGVLPKGDGHRYVKAGTTELYTRVEEHCGLAHLVMTLTEIQDV